MDGIKTGQKNVMFPNALNARGKSKDGIANIRSQQKKNYDNFKKLREQKREIGVRGSVDLSNLSARIQLLNLSTTNRQTNVSI